MALHPSYPLRSLRLALRPVSEQDVEALVSYRSRPEVCRYVPFEPMDAAAVRERLRGSWARQALEGEGEALFLGVEITATGELIGDVLLAWTSAEHRGGEIGYVLHPAYAGQGYATEATHRLLHVAFDNLGLHRVIARVDADNESSARLAARLGMRREAHLVRNEWFKGRWSDELTSPSWKMSGGPCATTDASRTPRAEQIEPATPEIPSAPSLQGRSPSQ